MGLGDWVTSAPERNASANTRDLTPNSLFVMLRFRRVQLRLHMILLPLRPPPGRCNRHATRNGAIFCALDRKADLAIPRVNANRVRRSLRTFGVGQPVRRTFRSQPRDYVSLTRLSHLEGIFDYFRLQTRGKVNAYNRGMSETVAVKTYPL